MISKLSTGCLVSKVAFHETRTDVGLIKVTVILTGAVGIEPSWIENEILNYT